MCKKSARKFHSYDIHEHFVISHWKYLNKVMHLGAERCCFKQEDFDSENKLLES